MKALRSLFGFGGYLFFSGLLGVFYTRLHTLLIGKLYSSSDLGFYVRADATRHLPSSILASIVERVTFPVFSSVANNPELLRQGMRKSLMMLMLVNLPICLGLAAVARPLVLTCYGENWAPCVPFLQILSLAGVFWPLHIANLSLLKAMGRSDLFFRLEVIKQILGFSVMLLASTISMIAMAWSVVLLSLIAFSINAYYTGVLLGYPASRQVRDFFPCLVATGVMAACVWPLARLTALPPPLLLIIQVFTGIVIFVLLNVILKISTGWEILREISLWTSRLNLFPLRKA